jgi:hypothetical protein
MEIQALKVVITEADLNELAQKHLPDDQSLDDVQILIAAEGVTIKGKYQLFLNVSFEVQWEIGVHGGKLTARLANIRALGMPGSIFKSAVMKLIGDAAKAESWLTVDNDSVLVDADAALRGAGIHGKTNITRVTCQKGSILVEGGTS